MKALTTFTSLLVAFSCGCVVNRVSEIPPPVAKPDSHRSITGGRPPEIRRAFVALNGKDYSAAATLYSNAVANGITGRDADPRGPDDTEYNAARCYARLGATNLAFQFLMQSLGTAWRGHLRRDPDLLSRDPDLAPLHTAAQWKHMIRRLTAERRDHFRDYARRGNLKLYELVRQDQMDRHLIDWTKRGDADAAWQRDKLRYVELEKILAAGEVSTAEDHYNCALLLMHNSQHPPNLLKANTMAREAVRLGSRNSHARWLIASSQDRYLWRMGKSQWYGTQAQRDENGKLTLEPIDESAVTDAQRRELNVPTIAERRQWINSQNERGQ